MNPVNTKPYILPADATWLITGSSQGIGAAIAKFVQSKGQRLIATARNPASLSYLPDNDPNILKLALDVTSETSVDNAFKAAAAHFGKDFHLDVVVNNAGYSLSGDTENASQEETHEEIETLLFGVARVTTRAIKIMREHKDHRGGLFFNISSVAGTIGFPGHAWYHAGKWALEGWTESVAREMHPDWNIHFCLFEPGGINTNFEFSSKKHIKSLEAYAAPDLPARQLEAWVAQSLQSNPDFGVEPESVAKVLWEVASRKENVPLRLVFGAMAVQLVQAKYEGNLKDIETNKALSLLV